MTRTPSTTTGIPRSLLWLLAATAGLSVANLYYAQPLAAAIAASLHATPAQVGSALMATQVGYALGMLLLVPLGDGRERRSVIVSTLVAAVPALLMLAASWSTAMLIASSLLVGIASAVPQMILPYAVDIAQPTARGKVVGTVMSGLLAGILLSRTASGALGAAVGWRAVFVLAALAMGLLAIVLHVTIPRREPAERIAYVTILRSLATVVRTEPVLRRRAMVGGLGFAAFSAFWSMLSFHLETLGYGSAVAGTFGAIGLVGVFVAPVAARLATRPKPWRINVVALAMIAISLAIFWIGQRSLIVIGVGVVLLDAGVQASQLTNQTVIFGLTPALRSRINALYMVSYFGGGALGSVSASLAWSLWGWGAVCLVGAAFALLGMLPLVPFGRSSARVRTRCDAAPERH
ncbi:MAG: MFS transporter [Polyangiaceae bacterium]|nr:MFS transporter [Polyangiaceae bacterium]